MTPRELGIAVVRSLYAADRRKQAGGAAGTLATTKSAFTVVEEDGTEHASFPFQFIGLYVDPPKNIAYDMENPEFVKAVLRDYTTKYPAGHGISISELRHHPNRWFHTTEEVDVPVNRANINRIARIITSGDYFGTTMRPPPPPKRSLFRRTK